MINLINKFFKKTIRKNNYNYEQVESNQAFLEKAYQEILGRDIDENGLISYTKLLNSGYSRTDVLLSLVKSSEFTNKILLENYPIQNLRELNPSKYTLEDDISHTTKVLVFDAKTPEDFDWLERMILEHDYYEKPGVWSFDLDIDKKMMAEIMSVFQPNPALEIGCANGTILQCLHELGIYCEGVEISRRAINKAFPQIKNNIHKGDLLELEFNQKYDLVFGLDIFEHLNINKFNNYLEKIYQILKDDGYLFCNIPVFGEDPVFGAIFPIYIQDWQEDIDRGKNFSKLHVDKDGYPMHGHLIWADSQWWVKQFEHHNFYRQVDIEKALHEKYDTYMNQISIGRKTYYVFSKNPHPQKNKSIIEQISLNQSKVFSFK